MSQVADRHDDKIIIEEEVEMSIARVHGVVLACATALALGAMAAALPASAAEPAAHDLSGTWWILNYNPQLVPMDGKPVPYTKAGKALADANAAEIAAHTFVDPPLTTCLLPGLPRAMRSAYPMKIVQHDRSVTFIHEQTRAFWHAIVGVRHTADPLDVDLAFMGGESVAKWEGDTLTIDSIAFKPKTYLDDAGMPHGDDLKVIQRLRKINGGKDLENIVTIQDPAIFTKSWTAKITYEWRPDIKIMEYVCGEPKRLLTGSRAAAMTLRWKPR